MSDYTPILDEALEIIRNARAAFASGEITQEQRDEVIRQTIEFVGVQFEVITEPIKP